MCSVFGHGNNQVSFSFFGITDARKQCNWLSIRKPLKVKKVITRILCLFQQNDERSADLRQSDAGEREGRRAFLTI
jgi:hypothetical protein